MTTPNTTSLPGAYGATKRTWREVSTRVLLAKLIRENPRASDAELQQLYDEEVRESETYLASVIQYAFNLDLRAYRNGLRSATPLPAPVRAARESIKAATDAKVKEAVKKAVETKARLVLLDLTMPNGKALRDCTGRECKELATKTGGWLKALGERLKPSQTVGAVLSEAEVQALYKSA